jgi:hypothetical protein
MRAALAANEAFQKTETALGLVKAGSFQVPALVADIGHQATKRYFEFFTVPIRLLAFFVPTVR